MPRTVRRTQTEDLSTPPRARAAALPPEERRAAIVEATVPLLLEHGPAVTTRQIAEAAGIAEGTIFRVFPDKDAVIDAAVEAAFDPLPTIAAIRGIDPSLPLEDRLARAVDLLQQRITRIWQLLGAVGVHRAPNLAKVRRHPERGAIAGLFEPDRDLLVWTPEKAAEVLHGFTIGCTHPAFGIERPMPPADIVTALLDGIRRGSPPASSDRRPTHETPART